MSPIWRRKDKEYAEAMYFQQAVLRSGRIDTELRIACPGCKISNTPDETWLLPTEDDVSLWRCWSCGKAFRVSSEGDKVSG